MEELIREYYDKKIKVDGCPDFKTLSFDEKYLIANSMGFAAFNLSLALRDLGKALSKLKN